ncbi:MAG: hypothetical protein K6E97_08230 [Treponema sp.]|nr:hypothetical protein [Treponema sp.]
MRNQLKSKKSLFSYLTAVLFAALLFGCDVTALSTDIIEKEQKTNEIKYKIKYTNDDYKDVYQFRFEDINDEYYQDIIFDFNSFYGTEGLFGIDGELGFFFNIDRKVDGTIINESDWDPDTPDNKKICDFNLLTVKKYVDYDDDVYYGSHYNTYPTVYNIRIFEYENVYYPNLVNKNIIGDSEGYDIDSIYCDVDCSYKSISDDLKIYAEDFKGLRVNKSTNKIVLLINKDEGPSIFQGQTMIFGLYSKIKKGHTLKGTWHFSQK